MSSEDRHTRAQFAALDLGSNSFHLVLASVNSSGRLQLIDRYKESVRLAAGLGPDNRLSQKAQARALAALARLAERVAEVESVNFRAVGTNTFRKARNGAAFLKKAEAVLGRPIEIISGIEEARLVYRGVALDCDLPGARLVVDIGGGSTEIILGEGETAHSMDSLYMGCVSYTQRFFRGGVISRKAFIAAETAAGRELSTVVRKFRHQFEHAVGSSGTIGAINRSILAEGLGDSICLASLEALRDRILEFGTCEGIELPEISADRAQVLPGGLAILLAVFRQLRVPEMRRSDFALREGLLVEMQGRMDQEGVCEGTVRRLMLRFDVDIEQAHRVTATALDFFDQVAGEKEWGEAERSALRCAAQLHEVGLFMGYSGHHKHGAYLLKNGEWPGFSRQFKSAVSKLILAHRGRLDPDRVAPEGGPGAPEPALAVLFRLAVRLHRRRSNKALPSIGLAIKPTGFNLQIPRDWLAERPLTRADLKEEVRASIAVGMELEFG